MTRPKHRNDKKHIPGGFQAGNARHKRGGRKKNPKHQGESRPGNRSMGGFNAK